MYQYRDAGIKHMKARRNHRCYGMGLGIIIVDDVFPGFPGDVRNPSAYPFPIQFEIAENVDVKALVVEADKSFCLAPIQRAAKKLEQMGCRAIVGEGGYFCLFQKEIAGHVDIPVFISSLLQVRFAQQLVGSERVVGILASEKEFVSDDHLKAVDVEIGSNYVMAGAEDEYHSPEFEHLWSMNNRTDPPGAFYEKAEKNLVDAGVAFFECHPNMGAMVLECSGYPAFARALQREIDIPVFSYGTLLEYAYSVAVHRDYYGHV